MTSHSAATDFYPIIRKCPSAIPIAYIQVSFTISELQEIHLHLDYNMMSEHKFVFAGEVDILGGGGG